MAKLLNIIFHQGRRLFEGDSFNQIVDAVNKINGNPATATALNTVGAGTITAAGIASGIINRGGSQSGTPFTDTTDTAANIIASIPLSAIGGSFQFDYVNNTTAQATIAGGTGVTVSNATVIASHSWVRYLVTYTAANTLTMVAVEQGYFPAVGILTINGATPVTVANSRVTPSSYINITLKTVGGTVSPSVPYIATITAGTGFTITGTAGDSSVYNYEIRG